MNVSENPLDAAEVGVGLGCALGAVPQNPVLVHVMGAPWDWAGETPPWLFLHPRTTGELQDFLQAGGKQQWDPSPHCSSFAEIKAVGREKRSKQEVAGKMLCS